VTAETPTRILIPKIRDRDKDLFKIVPYTSNVTNIVKFKTTQEIDVEAKEEDVGSYIFSFLLIDVNPFPLFNEYIVNLTVVSKWYGRHKQSKTLNATVRALNQYGEVIIIFNDNILIIDNYTNSSYFN
jgi:hypothetical protein